MILQKTSLCKLSPQWLEAKCLSNLNAVPLGPTYPPLPHSLHTLSKNVRVSLISSTFSNVCAVVDFENHCPIKEILRLKWMFFCSIWLHYKYIPSINKCTYITPVYKMIYFITYTIFLQFTFYTAFVLVKLVAPVRLGQCLYSTEVIWPTCLLSRCCAVHNICLCWLIFV